MGRRRGIFGSHLVQLGAGRGDLLDAELAELSLELAELLHQIILGLVPQLDRLDLARRLTTCQQFCSLQHYVRIKIQFRR